MENILKSKVSAEEAKFKESVIQSNRSLLNDCLKLGVNPNIEIEDGNYALHIAAEKADYPILRILLELKNIDINKKNLHCLTALMVACLVNSREAVQILLKEGANPNEKTNNGYTALHYACTAKSMGLVFDLIGKGAQINNCINVFDMTPLSISVIDQPSMGIVRFLLRKGARINEQKEFPLFLEAALTCHSEAQVAIFKVLVQKGVNINQLHPIEERNCLHYVAFSGYVPLAQYLVTLNIEKQLFARDITGRTPTDLALDHHNFMVANLFKLFYIMHNIRAESKLQLMSHLPHR